MPSQGTRHESDSEELEDDDLDFSGTGEKFGSLVTDSYGKLRFVGGATNAVLIEAIQSLSPGQSTGTNSPGTLSVSRGTTGERITRPLEVPLFVQGQRWPELPHLPKAEQLNRPPQYISDLLVNLYFDQLHYTLPVLHKKHFLTRYRQMNSPRSAEPPDRKFLSVFFAVCACASSLLPSNGKSSRFAGLDYYEKALLLHYASTGDVSPEAVQCLALLAMCCAGWNTLTQSWNYAGRAVRAAQDLGMHLSSLSSMGANMDLSPAAIIRQQLSRRIWWSVYCLDRVISICLGRPMAAQDADCHCELPMDISDDDLDTWCRDPGHPPQNPQASTLMTGFLAFARLCRIGGKIQQLYSPLRIRELSDPTKAKRYLRTIGALDKKLNEWLASLPDDIRFSANDMDRGPNLTMCVIMFIVHAGSLLNLYRSLMGNVNQSLPGLSTVDAVSHCISAAKSCINAAELVRELVPPSHHLAFCVHYLTLSGLVLLQMPGQPRDQNIADVKKCVTFLKDLEMTWNGAAKSRAIIEQLMGEPSAGPGLGHKKTLAVFETMEPFAWDQAPGSELFNYDVPGADLLNAWLP
ncbi:fungal-specific transcription factor domain-containing protein [Truncatella angustata]|uniref:Fungal-specific transcription factor domain-containing protein n=1 Tax=Truncatella angustata TaxID=152316 RepID=A0A9P8UCA8_9PEZI|nr:fungal-specific transcription factor domain-containing protein [Truncatella angustata]KAH6647177.1 fungal-specific transcription factor domain-containing protein [Truncatella angustata]